MRVEKEVKTTWCNHSVHAWGKDQKIDDIIHRDM